MRLETLKNRRTRQWAALARVALLLPGLLLLGTSTVAEVTSPPSVTRLVRFGEPVIIHTAVLRATAIVLHRDERLRSITQPDGERWQIDYSAYGPDGGTTPVITVTPTDCGLTTNIVALTTRRVYPILLRSPACELSDNDFDPQLPFDAVVRYRYPADELVEEVLARGETPPQAPPTGPRLAAPLEEVVANAARFSWKDKRGYRGPEPLLVTDDGSRTFLVFPEGAWKQHELPLFFLVNEEGERELANFEVEGTTFIVRTTFREAVLVPGGERRRRQPCLVITRKP